VVFSPFSVGRKNLKEHRQTREPRSW